MRPEDHASAVPDGRRGQAMADLAGTPGRAVDASDDRVGADGMSLHEMLRIMDVARELRISRESAEAELEADAVRAALRERLLNAAAVAGDAVTPEEIDVAIERYFETQHVYEDPPIGPSVILAHLYVRRTTIAAIVVVGALVAVVMWGLFFRSAAPLSSEGRNERAAAAARDQIAQAKNQLAITVRNASAAAREPEAKAEIEQLTREAEAFADAGNLAEVSKTSERLAALQTRLTEEYEVHIVAGPGKKSGIDRYSAGDKKLSGVYLIVEARAANGDILKRRIHNREENQDHEVASWGEQVPQEVYDRVKQDKQADGVLDRTLFAVKRRGHRHEDIVFPGVDGKPLARQGQITSW